MLLISKFIFSFSARPPPVFPFIKQPLRYITAEIILTEQNKAADPTRGHFWLTDESLILQFAFSL